MTTHGAGAGTPPALAAVERAFAPNDVRSGGPIPKEGIDVSVTTNRDPRPEDMVPGEYMDVEMLHDCEDCGHQFRDWATAWLVQDESSQGYTDYEGAYCPRCNGYSAVSSLDD